MGARLCFCSFAFWSSSGLVVVGTRVSRRVRFIKLAAGLAIGCGDRRGRRSAATYGAGGLAASRDSAVPIPAMGACVLLACACCPWGLWVLANHASELLVQNTTPAYCCIYSELLLPAVAALQLLLLVSVNQYKIYFSL